MCCAFLLYVSYILLLQNCYQNRLALPIDFFRKASY
ncbi:hypothetical protein NIES4071_50210 [Calothrix sp. NIES-4071]|nr:hypothetical protein NIES4071_50210 [Calothrix sp. NIES-4071]BAZ59328.1 hypothetical protein NIES4105_50150 [Calothrix sp. NIES-4105]